MYVLCCHVVALGSTSASMWNLYGTHNGNSEGWSHVAIFYAILSSFLFRSYDWVECRTETSLSIQGQKYFKIFSAKSRGKPLWGENPQLPCHPVKFTYGYKWTLCPMYVIDLIDAVYQRKMWNNMLKKIIYLVSKHLNMGRLDKGVG